MSEDSIKYLGKSIHKYRKLKGMTQGKLAEFSDISVTFLSKLERAETDNISIKKLENIAHALDVNITDLLSNQPQHNNGNAHNQNPNLDILIKQLLRLDHKKSERLAKYFSLLINEIENKSK